MATIPGFIPRPVVSAPLDARRHFHPARSCWLSLQDDTGNYRIHCHPAKGQSSSCWRMAGKCMIANGANPNGALFQSSSCWRVAGKLVMKTRSCANACGFNPHHAGEWLESQQAFSVQNFPQPVSILIMLANGWKAMQDSVVCANAYRVSILIMLANGWKVHESCTRYHGAHGFNPHHAGEWLIAHQSVMLTDKN